MTTSPRWNRGDQASTWLMGRLNKLETRVREASSVRRLLSEGVGEALVDVGDEPLRFSRDASERLRRYGNSVRRAALDEVAREGFQLDSLDQMLLGYVADNGALAVEIADALRTSLRRRIEVLGSEGNTTYEAGRRTFEDIARRVSVAVEDAYARWVQNGPGKQRNSRLFWRRRRAQRLKPEADPDVQLQIREAVRAHEPELKDSLRDVGAGALNLSLAQYYNTISKHLSEFIESAEILRERSRRMCVASERHLRELRREAASAEEASPTEAMLLGDDVLDAVLDRLGVNTTALLGRGDARFSDLASMDSEAFQEVVRDWISGELGHLTMPTLAEALSGLREDSASVQRRLLDILTHTQPLSAFNDDLQLPFEGGMRAQYFVIAECNDSSLHQPFAEACRHMGLPHPLVEVCGSDGDEGSLSLRVMQFAAGLTFFSQAERLIDMIETHHEVMSGTFDETSGVVGGLSEALRDLPESRALPDLLPESIEDAFQARARPGGRSVNVSRILGEHPREMAEAEVMPLTSHTRSGST